MPTRPRQLYLSPGFKPRTEHGHGIRKGLRKNSRPLNPKKPVHLVLRSAKARGDLALDHFKTRTRVENLARRYARHFGVKIYEYANAGNHLHLVIKGPNREALQNYFRKLAGGVAQLVTGAKKGRKFGRFWDFILYTRILEWGRALKFARDYVTLNAIEAGGIFIPGLRMRKVRPPPYE